MNTLRIEHQVTDYKTWKDIFDGDPLKREPSGVLRYRISRGTDDESFITIELDFEHAHEAESFQRGLMDIWKQTGDKLLVDPRARILESVETKEY